MANDLNYNWDSSEFFGSLSVFVWTSVLFVWRESINRAMNNRTSCPLVHLGI